MTTYTSFYFTKAGVVIPTLTGTISFLSSSTIIYIIAHSKGGIKTAYHRIILGLCIGDCLTSFATLLTTIPMPKDVIYPFALPSYGNVATCEAQGLIYIIGIGICYCMNGILNIYYVCTLRFNMKEKTFRKNLEIPLYTAMLALSFGISCGTLLNQEILNPSPTDPYCIPNSYPADCTKEDNPDCRGGKGRGAFNALNATTISMATFTLFVTMTLIIHSFYRNERKIRKAVKDKHIQEDDEGFQALLYAQETSRIITRQALLYIAAFVITWIFGLFEFLWYTEVIELTDRGARIISTFRVCLQPLQGLFNLIIFVYHKAHVRLRSDEDLTLGEAIIEVFLNPVSIEDSVQIHNLDVVFEDAQYLYGPHMKKGPESEIENGLEEVNLNDNGVNFNSGNASKGGSSASVRSGVLPSIDEEKVQTRKYYVVDDAAPFTDKSLANNHGVCLASEHTRSPSQARSEWDNRTEVFNDVETDLSGSRLTSSMLSGFPSIESRKSPD